MRDITIKEDNVRFNVRVSLIIENDNKLLFQVMSGDTNYTLIGGKVNMMETSLEALKRELIEEIDYDVSNDKIKLVQIAENFFDYIDPEGQVQNIHNILFIYKIFLSKNTNIRMDSSFPMKDKESTRLCWVSKEGAKNASILPKEAKNFFDQDKFVYGIINDLQGL